MCSPTKPSLSKATICGISPRCGVTGVGGCCWATASVALNSTTSRPSIHRFIASLVVSLTGSSVAQGGPLRHETDQRKDRTIHSEVIRLYRGVEHPLLSPLHVSPSTL